MEPKTFLRRLRKTQATRAAVDKQSRLILEELHQRMEAIGYEDKPEAECFVRLQEQLTGFVEAHLERLDRTLEERNVLRGEAPFMRERRDELAAELYETLVNLRGTIRSNFGAGYEGQLFGTGKTPRDPLRLAGLAGEIVNQLREPELQEQLSGSPFAQFDWDVTADDLDGKVQGLETSLREIDGNTAGQRSAVRRKDQAATDFDRTQKGMFKVLEGLMEMAGMDDMVRGLRPTEPARRGASADPAKIREAGAVQNGREREIDLPDASEPAERDDIAAAAGSEPASQSSNPPLRLVEFAAEAANPGPDAVESAAEARVPVSDPPAVAKPRKVKSPGRLRASTHPVRTASDPPGGASHRGIEGSEEVGARRHAV